MVNYREIIRLSGDHTQHEIAASLHCSRNTIRDVLKRVKAVGLSVPLDESITNKEIKQLLYPEKQDGIDLRKEPDYKHIHSELAKSGVNLTLLWSEYCNDCRINGLRPYMYSQFCDRYRSWARITKATMRIHHKPGDAMQVDWAGTTLEYHDSLTGEISEAYIFAAVLPCSCYAYVEACCDMKTTNWLLCHVHAYEYFGGVTRLLIPDNLKTGVTSNSRYETILNRSYREMAEHYKTAVVPARVLHPKDKSSAEGTVRIATTWIIAALRTRKFFSFEEVRTAVAEKLEELNERPFKKREGCRRSAYLDEEKAYMKPLPASPYEPAVWSTAKVPLDYLISDGKNKYSVPFDLIGEHVDIRITRDIVEIFFHGSRVASHMRSNVSLRNPVVNPDHMPKEHKKYLSYNADEFKAWAATVGPETAKTVDYFLTLGTEPEQGYKSCIGLSKLADKYGCIRVENACKRLNAFSSAPSVRNISTILRNGQDKISASSQSSKINVANNHGITRGASYFKGGED